MIKLFIFDMGGVLARDFDILPKAAQILGMSEQHMLNYIEDDMEGLMDGSIPSAEFWRRFTRRSSVQVKGNLLLDLFNPRLDEATKNLILRIREFCPAVCGTNTMAEHYNHHRARGDYDVFDRVYASHLMGIAKPRHGFFRQILESESIRPEETVFCDDLSENVESARELGIQSFLFRNAELFTREVSESGLRLQ